ncbi:hypothetical protein [Anaeromyxobacter oryzae]|uniref:Uncharacterized protein n=1 Tax=Anaeromyxobacter oryzae TaxID=2918170 RepID=A0ABM7WZT3_9BACT|nr:hypothetical protein [Anaeromyxobacter oryzae]BDG04990.1 hypothetical protein AMOR_39860 [Anaeromyxobacter oryzae]
MGSDESTRTPEERLKAILTYLAGEEFTKDLDTRYAKMSTSDLCVEALCGVMHEHGDYIVEDARREYEPKIERLFLAWLTDPASPRITHDLILTLAVACGLKGIFAHWVREITEHVASVNATLTITDA